MKPLQRKFFLVSAMIHGLLLVVLLVGPAFVRKDEPPPRNLPVLHVIPSRLLDEAVEAQGSAPAPPTAQPQPVTRPPQRQPQPQRQVTRPEPVQRPPVREPAKPAVQPQPVVKKPTPVKPKPPPKNPIKIRTTLEQRSPDAAAKAREQQAAREREKQRAAAQKLQQSVQAAVREIEDSVSKATNIDIPGPGSGAYANYSQAVRSQYDRAWRDPQQVQRDTASVLVEVVVSRTGKVVSDRILRRSGSGPMDRSMTDALETVRRRGLPPFPVEAKDSQRRFVIEFNLKTRRSMG